MSEPQTERPKLTLDEAIALLVDVHTRAEESPLNFSVQMAAVPEMPWHWDRYVEAWGVLVEHRQGVRSAAELVLSHSPPPKPPSS